MSDTQADTATDTQADTAITDATTTESTTSAADLVAELEKWKAVAKRHEARAAGNSAAAKELETLKQQTMSDVEKAAAVAKTEGRIEALREVGGKLVDAEVRAAAAGRPVDVDALLEGLDRSRFIDEQGDADRAAITAWVDRVAPAPEEDAGRPAAFDLGQGVRPDPSTALNGDPLLRDLKAHLGIR